MASGFSIGDLVVATNIAYRIYSALNHVARSRKKVDELVPFLTDTGCGRSSLIKTARHPEDQDLQISDSDCADGDPHSVYFRPRNHARTKWKENFSLSELRTLAAELQSLRNRLVSIKSEMDCLPGKKEMADTGLDDQLRMVVWSCEDFCARADKFMGYTRGRYGLWWTSPSAVDWLDKSAVTQRPRPWFSAFTPMCKLRQFVVSNISQREIASLQWEQATEKQGNAMDRPDQSLVHLALSVRNLGRAALPDEDLPHQVCGLSDVLCFSFSTLVCPSLTWLSLRSLDLEAASALDQSILNCLPSVATWITTLRYHRSICFTIVASSTIISTGATALPVWKSCMRGRLSAYVSSWLLIAVGSVLWSTIGGSIATLFLEFMPFALGFGVALGLLWHKRMSNAQ